MDNKEYKVILKVNHTNWGLKGPGSWDHTEYTLYSDGLLESFVTYVSDEGYGKEGDTKSYTYHITNEEVDEIIKSLEESKSYTDTICACDGSAYEFIQYEDNKEIYKRDNGYIYGIGPLEYIANIFYKYENENNN